MPVFCQRGFACGETARPVIGPAFGVCRAKSGAAFRCAKPPCAVVRFAAMTSSPRTDVLACPAFALLSHSPTALLNTPALVAVRLHFAARNRAGRSLPPPGATCLLPHFRFAQMWPRARTPALVAVRLHFAARNRAGRSLPPPGATCSLPHFRFAQMWPRARTPAQAAAAASAPAVFAAAETVSSATRAAAAPRRMARMKCPARRQAMYISPPRLFSFVFSFSFFPPFLTMGSLLRQRPPRISSRRQNRQRHRGGTK